MSDQKPTARIFLDDIFQEFPPHASRSKDCTRESSEPIPWPGEWRADWRHDWDNWRTNWPNDWAGNWTNNSSDSRFLCNTNTTSLKYLLLRSEDFGGIAYSPKTKCVYSFNHSGFALLQKLQAGMTPKSLISESLTEEDLEAFFAELKKMGIIHERG